MRLLFSLLFIINNLFALNILNYKIYNRSDRTDLLLNFDTPYNGHITKENKLNKTTFLIYDAIYNKQIEKGVNSKFIHSFSIIPQKSRVALVLTLNKNVLFNVSKTVNNLSLRFRFYKNNKLAISNKQINRQENIIKQNLPTKSNNITSYQYIVVIVILIIAGFILLFVRYKFTKSQNISSWLFKKNQKKSNNFNILFQKPIDNINKVVLLEVNKIQYLVILGNSHLLLNTFNDKHNVDEDDFKSILKDNQQELDNYIQLNTNKQKNDPLQSYKEKASLEVYRSNM